MRGVREIELDLEDGEVWELMAAKGFFGGEWKGDEGRMYGLRKWGLFFVRILTPMETPDPPSDTPGASKKGVFDTP